MKEQLVASGIQQSELDVPFKDLAERPIEWIRSLQTWLELLKIGPYAKVLATYSLREPQFWINMETLYGLHNTREQKDLKRARRLLRIAWRKRHGQPVVEAEAPVDDPVEEGTS